MKHCIEDALRQVVDGAAFVRHWADIAALSPEMADRRVLSGVADVCEAIHDRADAIRRALDPATLGRELR